MSQVNTAGTAEIRNRVSRAIADASARTGVDFGYLFNQARVESGLDPQADAKTSSAQGLFQFTRQTWLATVKEHGAKHGLGQLADAIQKTPEGKYYVADTRLRSAILELRNQPEAASAMAAEFASDNQSYLEGLIERPLETVDLYLAHFLGAKGAGQFLAAHSANPNADAAPLFPKAAGANQAIFYKKNGQPRSLDEIRNNFARKLGSSAPDFTSAPVSTGYAPVNLQLPLARASAPVERASSSHQPTPIRLLSIEPMPERLSLDFARNAYHRLAQMGGGRAA
jgi:hypothetical protein